MSERKSYEIVDAVAELLRVKGRCTGMPQDSGGRICLGRAMVIAITGKNDGGDSRAVWSEAYRDHPARLAICGAAGLSRLAHLGSEFNDKPDVSDERVFEVLALAAQGLRAQEGGV